MKVIVAPDSFKDSLSAADAAAAMARGIRRAAPGAQVESCPIADGGEGTVDALIAATGGRLRRSRVTGPLGEPVDAAWGMLGDSRTAVIEMAAASGLVLVPPAQRDPTRTTTFGTGELIRAAMDAGAERIVLGLGGSATNDGGCGAAQALGAVFDCDPPTTTAMTGADLHRVRAVRAAPPEVSIAIACDVDNPLTGPEGAAHIYGPQKGATPEQVALLDRGLAHLQRILGAESFPGAGAAGGFGYGAVVLLGGAMRRGVELVLEAADFAGRAAGSALCLTGEGSLDAQTLSGKAVMGVARAAAAAGVPTVALAGRLGDGYERLLDEHLLACYEIGEGLSEQESIRRAAELLEAAAERAVREHGVRPSDRGG